ncbi:hypothetical protein CPG37_03495 [Malaciobacter canalis]|uniref:Tetratricopeptide repeat protein n=1 Tax=Malaciobacter canalis TaxID=1912871 RepID=A0ABX4LRG4_9BACT|nr:hypothetical protein [Malaciobacter canalis]PHO10522.1 hypothetical protein CPG37_03495 [Malaciobacter canalis]QEE31969.1 tetratricopeptide repeat protein [Malaciobacter canalis]
MIKKLLIVVVLCLSSGLYAKSSMSKSTYNSLMKAQEFMQKEDFKKAKVMLEKLLKEDKNSYEKSYILQTLANVYINDGEYNKVAKAYEDIIKFKAFEEKSIQSIKFSLSKVYLSNEQYKKSLALSKELLNSKDINKEDIYENLILAYYYEKDYKNSVKYSKKYFSLKKDIKESWYKVIYSSYVELKDYKNAISIMKKMVKIFNTKEEYWVQLASLYQQENQLKKSLSTLELAYKNNILTKKDNILYFINILLQNEVYKKAGELLTKAVDEKMIKEDQKIFEIIVSSYLNSKQIDLAIQKLQESKFAKKNKFQMILANIYYNQQEYSKSIEIVNKMQTKRNSKLDGEKQILKALCYYELDNKPQSIKTLKQIVNNPYHKRKAKSILKQLRS